MRNRIGNAGLTAAISMALLAAFPVIAWAAPVLTAGITAGSQSLAGMTAEEAKAAVQEYVDGLAAQSSSPSLRHCQDSSYRLRLNQWKWKSSN